MPLICLIPTTLICYHTTISLWVTSHYHFSCKLRNDDNKYLTYIGVYNLGLYKSYGQDRSLFEENLNTSYTTPLYSQ